MNPPLSGSIEEKIRVRLRVKVRVRVRVRGPAGLYYLGG
jgi:hypothetical protein